MRQQSWAESVDRVLQMRRVAQLEADKAELIRILQEAEKRCKFVVNRQESVVLKDVPSWKALHAAEASPEKPKTFRGGMRTWKDSRHQLEKQHRVEADRRNRRVKEFVQVLSGTLPLPEAVDQEEKSDVESAAT